MLDEHWSRHPDLQHIKVYQASGVARKALSVFQTYVGMMNSAIQEAVQVRQRGRQYTCRKGGKCGRGCRAAGLWLSQHIRKAWGRLYMVTGCRQFACGQHLQQTGLASPSILLPSESCDSVINQSCTVTQC
jgi:hypothetical protein